MTDDLQFQELKLSMPTLTLLHKHQLLGQGTLSLLQLAFEHGGYIAGGFAALVARHVVMLTSNGDFYASIMRHTNGPIKSLMTEFKIHGDIDVWFPSEPCLNHFLNDVRRSIVDLSVAPTKTGSAIEHIVDGDVRVQVVTRWLRPVQEQLAHFDIYNAMVGLTNDTLTVPDQWEALERANMLHVSSWASCWTVGRVLKYINSKGYTALTPSTAMHMYDEACKALEQVKPLRAEIEHARTMTRKAPPAHINIQLQRNPLLRHFVACNKGKDQYVLKPLLASLTAEQLLTLSMLSTASPDYDHAMKEIHRRMPVG